MNNATIGGLDGEACFLSKINREDPGNEFHNKTRSDWIKSRVTKFKGS